MPKFKLTHEEERQVTLAYLCGVNTEKIGAHWDVPKGITPTHIVELLSPEWNDPLIEFYQQTEPSERLRNAAHLYLVFQNRAVPNNERVDHNDRPVYEVVRNDILLPGIERVIAETSLSSALEPSNGFESLLVTLGYRSAERVTESILVNILHKSYGEREQLSLQEIFAGVHTAITEGMRKDGLVITPRKIEVIREVIGTLGYHEREVLSLRYGLAGRNKLTHAEVGQIFHNSRQIEQYVMSKLKQLPVSRDLEFVAGMATDDEVTAYRTKRDAPPQMDYWATPIEQLNISVRACKGLQRRGIETIGQLVQCTEEGLSEIRGLGDVSLHWIKDTLEQIGLRLKQPKEKCLPLLGGPMLPTVDYPAVGTYIQGLREQQGISLDQLTGMVNRNLKPDTTPIMPDQLFALEQGRLVPLIGHLLVLERILRMTPGDLCHSYGYLAPDEVPPHPRSEWLTLDEAASQLSISRTALRKAVQRGKITARHLQPPPSDSPQVRVVLSREDVLNYQPRNYPRNKKRE